MMDETFIRAIGEMADKAAAPHIIEDGKATDRYLVFHEGKFQAHPKPSKRDHAAGDLETVLRFAERFTKAEKGNEVPAIWYSRNRVVVLIDDSSGRDRVTMPLKLSSQIEDLIRKDNARAPLQHRVFVLWLRTTMAGCFPSVPGFIDLIRTVQFSQNSETGSGVKAGKVSLGKSIRAEMAKAEDLPETITFNVPIFTNGSLRSIRADVTCALDIDPGTETFTIIPLPGAIENAITAGEEDIRAKLAAGYDGHIYYGVP